MPLVWRFTDGKAGHQRQTAGLLEALNNRTPITVVDLDAEADSGSWWRWLFKAFPDHGPRPDLIVGAGSRCQLPMLAARRTHGGRLVYLMKPKFPTTCFDVCLVPRHDSPITSDRVIATDGVLNDIVRSDRHRTDQGLILIGGPSRHFAWDEQLLLGQIHEILAASRDVSWTIGDSRRTPQSTTRILKLLAGEQVEFVDHNTVDTSWIKTQLATAGPIWVTRDSVSMIFEALTAGASVGLLEVPPVRDDRITGIAADLIEREWVTTFAEWRERQNLAKPPMLNEASRAADLIIERFPALGA